MLLSRTIRKAIKEVCTTGINRASIEDPRQPVINANIDASFMVPVKVQTDVYHFLIDSGTDISMHIPTGQPVSLCNANNGKINVCGEKTFRFWIEGPMMNSMGKSSDPFLVRIYWPNSTFTNIVASLNRETVTMKIISFHK